ncbi:hypothetical protein KR093_006790 [Drosophila rubida]|uniref:WASH complex subunit 2 n=1 Tax=Drosophila rubida TaxID=30044 RepID=A0AAD4PKP4_9MUSC|nr:hypothetical protein KR093_006790 [Drosophila rubida]
MDIGADVAAIVEQASEWNFAGDCALLDLMKRISQNLQDRTERTTRNFNEFETNVRRAGIALDNATNSLRSLQFGQQFVEYRVEEVDDDDFAMPEDLNKKPELPAKSAEEMANEFLQNNLRMFRKNFEPVTIEVPDSDDDEEGATNTTTVFRAKNPYDAIPLPYIIGSKEWQEHKYAGLYDSAENSEDEQPEQFSSSSSDEQEVAAQKTTPKRLPIEPAQHSDSSSLTSLPKEPPISVDAQPAPPSPPQPAARAKAQPRPIISSQRNPHERDLFSALRASPPSDDPPSTSSSLNSSPAISQRAAGVAGLPRMDASLSSSSSSVTKPMLAGRQSPPKLFDEPNTLVAVAPVPAPTPIPATAGEEAEVKPVAAASQIKRKPVNLFNDDEFNSFMSEIVDKVQSKSSAKQTPAKTQAKQPAKVAATAPVEAQPVAKAAERPQTSKLNLFDDSPPLSPIATPAHKPAQTSGTPAKTLPKSLFDDNLDDDDDFLSALTSKAKPKPQIVRTSLFDDDDDDLDINDIFAKPKVSLPARNPIAKTSLFNDDEEDNVKDIFGAKAVEQPATSQSKSIPKTSLFDDEEVADNVKDIFGATKSAQKQDVIIPPKAIANTSLFDDEEEDNNVKDIFVASKPAPQSAKQQEPTKKQDVISPPKAIAKTSLFDDEEEHDNVKDIFNAKAVEQPAKPQEQRAYSLLYDKGDDVNVQDVFGAVAANSTPQPTQQPEQQKEQPEAAQPKTVSLFEDEEGEDINNDTFGSKTVAKPKDQPKVQEQASLSQKSLFDDLGDDDLFGTPKTSKNLIVAGAEKRGEMKAVNEEPPEDDVLPQVPKQEQKSEIKIEKQIAISKADLFNDDFGEEEIITKRAEVTSISTEITSTASKEIAAESIPNPQTEPRNKIDDVEFKNEAETELPPTDEVLDSLFGNLSDTRLADQAAELQQDPIISVVAEVTNKKPSHNESQTPHKAADIAVAQQIMQNYSSLFSDEPPDDSEFFQSLGTSSLHNLSTSKMFDNDHDFFEPSLPALPKTMSEQPVEQSSSDYGGMRLFSDVPPEDDGDEQPTVAPVQQPSLPAAAGVTTKRIHTIFYDDFSETARATPEQQQEVPQIEPQSKPQAEPQSEAQPKLQPTIDVVDSSELKKPTSPVKKLQMPNININVKALLPGAGTLPKLPKKQMEEQTEDQTKDQTEDNPELTKPSASQQVEKSSSADADNILQCVGKTRARGPARRPSTRRARQESYARSMREQHEVEPASPSPPASNIPSQQNNTKPAVAGAHSSLLERDNNADDALSGAVRQMPAVPVALLPTQPPEDDHRTVEKPSKAAASFLDSDDDDSGFLFSPPTATPAAAPKAVAKSTTKSTGLKQVSFLDSDEDENENESAALFSPPKSQVATTAASAYSGAKESTVSAAPNTASGIVPAAAVAPSTATAAPVTTRPVAQPKEQVTVKGAAALPNKKPTMMKSFLDSDDDDDALFSSLAKPVPAAPVAAVKPEKTVKTAKKVEAAPVPSQIKEQPKAKAIPSNAGKLFDDSDDDDDLFGGSKAKAVSAVQPAKTKPSLFGDSDSEEEAPPKTLSVKAKLPAMPHKSLFSDDEDDDDLFGGGGTKRTAVSGQAKPAQVATRHPGKTSTKQSSNAGKQQAKPLSSSGSGNSDNPLADLLGP